MKKIVIECHDCGEETIINNKYEDKTVENYEHCPCCGSTNIDVL